MVKYQIMHRFTIILITTYAIAFISVLLEIFYKFTGDRDIFWRYEWAIESCWFSIFSLFLFAVMILMRPNEKSKMLANLLELGEFNESQK